MTAEVVDAVRHAYPKITIYLWTGYEFENLILNLTDSLKQILSDIDVLIDGPFIEGLKDLSLKLRGSSNQHIRIKRNNAWETEE